MNVLALLPFLASVIAFCLGVSTFFNNKKSRLNKYFLLFCVFLSYGEFCRFMYTQAGNLDTAYFWVRLSTFWTFSSSFLLCFTLIFTEKEKLLKNKLFLSFIFLPTTIISVLGLTTDLIVTEPVKKVLGYSAGVPSNPVFLIIAMSYVIGITFASFVLAINFRFKTNNINKKYQAGYISGGILSLLLIYFFAYYLSRILKYQLSECIYTSFGDLVMISFISYSIVKYKLFVLDVSIIAENIIQTIPDSLIVANDVLNIIRVNQKALDLLGYEKETELIGRSANLIFAEEQPEHVDIKKIFKDNFVRSHEVNYKTKDEKIIPVLFSNSIIKDESGNLAGIVCVALDIRRLKEKEIENQKLHDQLIQSEKMAAIGKLTAGVAHEINNPMTVILGYSQNLLKKAREEDIVYKPLKLIEASAIRVKKIVGDLLIFSRTFKLTKELLNINEIVDKSLSILNFEFDLKKINILKDLSSDLPPLYLNKNQIEQVLVNLYNNSIDAMPSGGTIKVATMLEGEFIKILVSDTGMGISEKNRIFEPFFTTKKIGEGTGLGLSLCYEIIKKHDGQITFESEINKGTTFIIKLPVATFKLR
ncbi:MAG: ATP-binding protein [Candidatus Firestonebacteria bacterium]